MLVICDSQNYLPQYTLSVNHTAHSAEAKKFAESITILFHGKAKKFTVKNQ